MVQAKSLGDSEITLDYTNWKNDIYSKVKGLLTKKKIFVLS